MRDLTDARLADLLFYDPDTGKFFWRLTRSSKARAGGEAGSIQTAGYRQIVVDRRTYMAHRLAWLYCYGRWPDRQLDHINGFRDDNRLVNLREVEPHQQSHNTRRRPNVSSGVRGVEQYKPGKWRAHITIAGKTIHLGVFRSLEAAVARRASAEETLLGELAPPPDSRPEYPNTRPLKNEPAVPRSRRPQLSKERTNV